MIFCLSLALLCPPNVVQKDRRYHDFLTEVSGSSRANQEAQPARFTQWAHRRPVGTVPQWDQKGRHSVHMKVIYSVHSTLGIIIYPLVKSNGQLLLRINSEYETQCWVSWLMRDEGQKDAEWFVWRRCTVLDLTLIQWLLEIGLKR